MLRQSQQVSAALRLDSLDLVAAVVERVATQANPGSADR